MTLTSKEFKKSVLLKISSLNFYERRVLKKIFQCQKINRIGCLISDEIWQFETDMFTCTSERQKNTQEILQTLTKEQFINFDQKFALIYLDFYLHRFPLNNLEEAIEAERLFYKIPSEVTFYPLLISNMLRQQYLREPFRSELKGIWRQSSGENINE